eukprot:scaffold246178_cov33-Prasinocladus_malaysianus.AAC.1
MSTLGEARHPFITMYKERCSKYVALNFIHLEKRAFYSELIGVACSVAECAASSRTTLTSSAAWSSQLITLAASKQRPSPRAFLCRMSVVQAGPGDAG